MKSKYLVLGVVGLLASCSSDSSGQDVVSAPPSASSTQDSRQMQAEEAFSTYLHVLADTKAGTSSPVKWEKIAEGVALHTLQNTADLYQQKGWKTTGRPVVESRSSQSTDTGVRVSACVSWDPVRIIGFEDRPPKFPFLQERGDLRQNETGDWIVFDYSNEAVEEC